MFSFICSHSSMFILLYLDAIVGQRASLPKAGAGLQILHMAAKTVKVSPYSGKVQMGILHKVHIDIAFRKNRSTVK